MPDAAARLRLGIGYASLTSKRIFIGRINKAQNAFLDGKEDHTEGAVWVVAELGDQVHSGYMQLTHPRRHRTYRVHVEQIGHEQPTTSATPS